MLTNQNVPNTCFISRKEDRVSVKLCQRHSGVSSDSYNYTTQECTKRKLFMPKLKADHDRGNCHFHSCSERADYIAYGVKYKLEVEL